MKEERIKKLNKALKYLVKEERVKEIAKYDEVLAKDDVNINNIVKNVYLSRGIDYQKLKGNVLNDLVDTISDLRSAFLNKDSKVRTKMIVDILYIVLVLVLIKLPFDLVRDIGYDYINILTTNNTFSIIWQLVFLLLYTITFICTLVVFLKNFVKKYEA